MTLRVVSGSCTSKVYATSDAGKRRNHCTVRCLRTPQHLFGESGDQAMQLVLPKGCARPSFVSALIQRSHVRRNVPLNSARTMLKQVDCVGSKTGMCAGEWRILMLDAVTYARTPGTWQWPLPSYGMIKWVHTCVGHCVWNLAGAQSVRSYSRQVCRKLDEDQGKLVRGRGMVSTHVRRVGKSSHDMRVGPSRTREGGREVWMDSARITSSAAVCHLTLGPADYLGSCSVKLWPESRADKLMLNWVLPSHLQNPPKHITHWRQSWSNNGRGQWGGDARVLLYYIFLVRSFMETPGEYVCG